MTIREEWIENENGCWEWQGYIDPKTGYGKAYNPTTKRQSTAHRVVWAREHGEIPAGMDLDHLCRVRHCVRPDHLEIASRSVNAYRGSRSKLTRDEVIRIRSGGEHYLDLARELGVHHSTIFSARSGKTYKEILA